MMKNIRDVARVIRSKNSGPYELTLDIMFSERRYFDLFKARGVVSPELVSRLYGIDRSEILDIMYFEPANALKVTIRRKIPSGAPGDTDIYGAQQHAPLLSIEFEE
jgi:hypothetical protein